MAKSQFNLAGYALVAERITEFYERFETGRIITSLVSRDETIVFRAEVYRKAEDTAPAATGWASEREGDGEINMVACLENSETSAIGRALANLGFTASRLRPSYEEMQKAERARLRFQSSGSQSGEISGTPAMRVSEPGDGAALERPVRRQTAREQASTTLGEKISNRTSDVLLLLREAREKKITAPILEKFRQDLGNGFLTMDDLERMERQLRHWILNGYSPAASGGIGPGFWKLAEACQYLASIDHEQAAEKPARLLAPMRQVRRRAEWKRKQRAELE